ncbi:hypothetical protein [Demequina subtropica]|uniref:hypothetical protein n=1 Tax=Demequina subtropica TaxID=1638989 RepID=UPI00078389E3|nr:hypothetical protein [Demequina subtropica]
MNDTVPEYAQRRLGQRGWRLKRSWWVLVPLLTFGILCWAGYLWAGVKTQKRKYYISGAVWFAISLLIPLLPESMGTFVPIIAVTCIFVPTMQAIVMNQQYLVERAVRDL